MKAIMELVELRYWAYGLLTMHVRLPLEYYSMFVSNYSAHRK